MSKQSRARAAGKLAAETARRGASPRLSRSSPPDGSSPFLVRWGAFLAGGIIVLAALAAYHNSFSLPFIFDDYPGITKNSTIRHLLSAWSPPNDGSGVTGRPLVNFSLAVNYALGGLDVRGYHALNLAFHIISALALFGIVRRTLLERPTSNTEHPTSKSNPSLNQIRGAVFQGLTPADALLLALTVALLWAVHPLQTESVTCVVQRTESLMGLFYLLTLYCFIRAVEGRCQVSGVGYQEKHSDSENSLSRRSHRGEGGSNSAFQLFSPSAFWMLASVLCCLLGMASKEVMVSAPLMVLLYDRTFVAGTFREAWKKRGRWHAGLACTWLLLGYLMVAAGGSRGKAAGFGLGVTPWTYALTQCRAIILYLKLSLWPHPLVFDYGTNVVLRLSKVLPQALVLVMLVAATIVALWRCPALGFIGAWFFVILAPSSSVVPLVAQTVAEHRMYLPLAAAVVLAVFGLYRLIGRNSLVIFLAIAVGLGCITVQRNEDYRSEVVLWSDTITKYPNNERAHSNLGFALAKIPGHLSEAISEYEAALRINPDYADAHNNLGNALLKEPGRLPDAIAEFEQALRNNPNLVEAHYNLGNTLVKVPGRLPDAIAHFEAALRLDPGLANAHISLGNALLDVPGRWSEAIVHFEAALRLNPDSVEAHYDFGNALLNAPGHLSDAIAQYKEALRLKPDFAPARKILDQLQNPNGSE